MSIHNVIRIIEWQSIINQEYYYMIWRSAIMAHIFTSWRHSVSNHSRKVGFQHYLSNIQKSDTLGGPRLEEAWKDYLVTIRNESTGLLS